MDEKTFKLELDFFKLYDDKNNEIPCDPIAGIKINESILSRTCLVKANSFFIDGGNNSADITIDYEGNTYTFYGVKFVFHTDRYRTKIILSEEINDPYECIADSTKIAFDTHEYEFGVLVVTEKDKDGNSIISFPIAIVDYPSYFQLSNFRHTYKVYEHVYSIKFTMYENNYATTSIISHSLIDLDSGKLAYIPDENWEYLILADSELYNNQRFFTYFTNTCSEKASIECTQEIRNGYNISENLCYLNGNSYPLDYHEHNGHCDYKFICNRWGCTLEANDDLHFADLNNYMHWPGSLTPTTCFYDFPYIFFESGGQPTFQTYYAKSILAIEDEFTINVALETDYEWRDGPGLLKSTAGLSGDIVHSYDLISNGMKPIFYLNFSLGYLVEFINYEFYYFSLLIAGYQNITGTPDNLIFKDSNVKYQNVIKGEYSTALSIISKIIFQFENNVAEDYYMEYPDRWERKYIRTKTLYRYYDCRMDILPKK